MLKFVSNIYRHRIPINLSILPINENPGTFIEKFQVHLPRCSFTVKACVLYSNKSARIKTIRSVTKSKMNSKSSYSRPECEILLENEPESLENVTKEETNLPVPNRKRKTVAENLARNAKKWEAINSPGKKQGPSSLRVPDLIDLEKKVTNDKAGIDDDDCQIIEVISKSNVKSSNTKSKGPYSNESPLSKRQWINTKLGSKVQREGLKRNAFPFSVMSYNVLAQDLLELHPHLYQRHDPSSLVWQFRHDGLMKEMRHHLPDVVCFQEVQLTHLDEYFKQPLSKIGYEGIFKQRTGDKVDGCAIFWQRGKFKLVEESSVEFYQPGVNILNRDNIAIAVRLQVQGSTDEIVVATTHLLYNPRREDVRLAQTQLLLAELDRLSHIGSDTHTLPVILTGDFNLQPHTSVYNLITCGEYRYDAELVPRYLGITDCCRHFSLLNQRQTVPYTARSTALIASELSLLRLHHSQRKEVPSTQELESLNNSESAHKFGTGKLCHGLKLQSAYYHRIDIPRRDEEATTHQDDWVTVDYIFHSLNFLPGATSQRQLRLLSRWSLPRVIDCNAMGPIPNNDAPSDHLPIVACFLLS